jgi:hypothetical protein
MSFSVKDGQSEVSGDFSKLENLIANLKEKHFVEIGVFKTAKTPDGTPIAEYGAKNEFGSRKERIPARSFIRMPLTVKKFKIYKYVKDNMRQRLESGDIVGIFSDIGIAGESVIQEAFDTRGFGQWKENAESTIMQKGSDAPLIDKGFLRAAITHRVDGKNGNA